MSYITSNRGFAPLIVIAIIALIAVGGGAAYVVSQNNTRAAEGEATVSAESSVETDAGAQLSAEIDTQGTLRSLLGLGQSVMCTFTSSAGAESSGTVYVANGSMRTDFRTEAAGAAQTGSMIVQGDTSYVWMGSQGMKMDLSAQTRGEGAEQSVDLDAPVNYECQGWTPDSSKFTLPAGIEFVDIQAMMQGAMKGVDVKAMMQGTVK